MCPRLAGAWWWWRNVPRLGSLTSLECMACGIEDDVPYMLGCVPSLEHIDLRNNLLQAWPPSVCARLANVRTLNLSGNQLTYLPAAIERMSALTSLDVSNNNLLLLPPSIIRLEKLLKLLYHHNSMRTPPENLMKKGTTVVHYFDCDSLLHLVSCPMYCSPLHV